MFEADSIKCLYYRFILSKIQNIFKDNHLPKNKTRDRKTLPRVLKKFNPGFTHPTAEFFRECKVLSTLPAFAQTEGFRCYIMLSDP